MTLLFVEMVSIIPYSLFFINSFSVSGVLTRVSERASQSHRVGKTDTAALHAALSLRVLQHVGEVFTVMLLVWSEENPEKLLPRFRTDWSKTRFGNASYLQWFYHAVVAWCFACLIHTFEAIPFFVDEIKKVKTATWKNLEAS